MQKTNHPTIPAYNVTINTTAFQSKKPCLKERLQKQYLHAYWKKFKMDQKKIIPSCEDRLSELTTSQIDRIIDNEKLQNLLYSKKKKIPPIEFAHDKSNPNTHVNIYQANFLAKINELAIKRDIHYIPLEGMDDDFVKNADKFERSKTKRRPFKYAKEYNNNLPGRKIKTEPNEEDDVKSIESFQNNLDEFQVKLDIFKKSNQSSTSNNQNPSKNKQRTFKLIPENRWFYGMSTYYLKLNNQKQESKKQNRQSWKDSYDIQSELHNIDNQLKRSSFSTNTTRLQPTYTTNQQKKLQPFQKYKTSRVIALN